MHIIHSCLKARRNGFQLVYLIASAKKFTCREMTRVLLLYCVVIARYNVDVLTDRPTDDR